MTIGLLHGLCWRMVEMLPHHHSQPWVMCAWDLLGFLMKINVANSISHWSSISGLHFSNLI